MNIKIAADSCKQILIRNIWHTKTEAVSWDHCLEMCDKIISGEISGEKAHRWLGWLQACMCAFEISWLEELKQINYKS